MAELQEKPSRIDTNDKKDKSNPDALNEDDAQTNVSSPEDDLVLDGVEPVYAAKAGVLNQAINDIGMGRYQWQLFCVAGFGWAQDNLWLILTSLILSPVANEFNIGQPALLTLSQNIGLCAGAAFWGLGADIFGRKWAFNLTLGVTTVFALAAAGSPNFAMIAVFDAFWSFGVGGNMPVDSALFLEFVPQSHQYLLTVLASFWAISQLIVTGVAWGLLGKFTCEEDAVTCLKGDNMGWRWLLLSMGGLCGLMWFLRFGCFQMYESPKYFMGKGKDEEAVRIVHEIARRNGKESTLTVEDLKACEIYGSEDQQVETNTKAAFKRKLRSLGGEHISRLFASKKLGFSSGMIILIWGFIGLAFPLYNNFIPYTLAKKGAAYGDGSTYITYRNSCIIAVLGVPGAILGGYLVEINRLGRKGTLSVSAILTGVFIFGSSTALTSNSLLAWNCVYSFVSNIMYAVLCAYTPEIFPTRDRGTGNALAAITNRFMGVMAPIIAMFANLESSAPVYTSGALFIAAGLFTLILPYESRGKTAL
ncbi:hypothetical protein B9479_000473 [Cryptococcus floricola]|uniref:Major facilitator superfamily (MFS) profile domain-containing protein n=1 Tax=Cryptococcus floricola TaxID=2591691 RepID=A0A5D3B4K2_9TREE|nr:hypothetical protein B9479_000473 [Cryptococcus floricola]